MTPFAPAQPFHALIEEMKRAKKYIHVQYYIIRNDEVWQDIEKVLTFGLQAFSSIK